jgi:hypothetical protein
MNEMIKESGTSARLPWPRITFALFVATMWLATVAKQARAQTIIINPICGAAGSSVSITGSGWQEEAPLCHYNFLFDGAAIAAPQEDSSFGPPNATGTVPSGATNGPHTIKIELRDDDTNRLIQCMQNNFTVVTGSADPWNGGANVTTGSRGVINDIFNPTNVCSVTDCTLIAPIQAIQLTGHVAGSGTPGTTQTLTYTQLPFANGALIQPDQTPPTDAFPGWAIDYVYPAVAGKPFYPFANLQHNHFGVQGSTPVPAGHFDQPGATLGAFPANIDTLTFNFEVNYLCAAGENRGEWVGQYFWTWIENKANASTLDQKRGAASITGGPTQPPPNGPGPTGAFMGALNLFEKNHGWPFPIGIANNPAGEPCN